MSHEVNKLLASLYNTPHLATVDTFSVVESYLSDRSSGEVQMSLPEAVNGEIQSGEIVDGIGYLRVEGPLTYKPVVTLCGGGGTNYQSLYEQMQGFVDQGVKTVNMVVDSGGGMAYNCFDYATAIRQLATDNNIHLIGYVDGMAASAAYALLCQCDTIVANPSAEVGSIGVIVSLLDSSKAMSDAGYKRVMVSAGGQKHPFNADGGFKEEFIADLQAKVDTLYERFVDHVSTSLNVDPEIIRSTDAKTFLPEKAMEYGLVDKVMTDFEFAAYLDQFKTTKKEKKMGFFNRSGARAEATQAEEVDMELQAQVKELQASLEANQAELASMKEQLSAMADAKAKAEAALATKEQADAQAKADKRKAELSAVVGDAALEATYNAVAGLDDAAFAVVLNGFKAGNEAQAKSEMFTEMGVGGDASPAVEASAEASQEDLVVQKLKAKYGAK